MTTFSDVANKTHSYRNHDPKETIEIANNSDLDHPPEKEESTHPTEALRQAQSALRFIESGRLDDFAGETFEMFIKLDRDEKELFTRRNPDLVQWTAAWGASREATDPLTEWFEFAAEQMGSERLRAVDPPLYERKSLDHDTLIEDMMFRRRSYRNWTPQEFENLYQIHGDKMEVTKGMARELSLFSREARDRLDFPVEEETRTVVRGLLDRIEAGRFTPMLREGLKGTGGFFGPLDLDERRLFAERNPGIVMWLSTWGKANHLIHGPQMGVEFPTLRETGDDGGRSFPGP